jgi:hypothetical protein
MKKRSKNRKLRIYKKSLKKINNLNSNLNYYNSNKQNGGKKWWKLFVEGDDENINNNYNSNNERTNTENQKVNTLIEESNNIMKNWIQNTDNNTGLTLYFAKEDNNSENGENNDNENNDNNHNNWNKGYHGNSLNKRKKLVFNPYIMDKIQKKSVEAGDSCPLKSCLKAMESRSNADQRQCLSALEKVQEEDINTLKKRVDFNTNVNLYINQWIGSNIEYLKSEEEIANQQILEIKQKMEETKTSVNNQTTNLQQIICQNNNFNNTLNEYFVDTPNYEFINSSDLPSLEYDKRMMNYINFSVDKGNTNSKEIKEYNEKTPPHIL